MVYQEAAPGPVPGTVHGRVIEGQRSQPATNFGSKHKCVATRACAQKSLSTPCTPLRMLMVPVAVTRTRTCGDLPQIGPFDLKQNYGSGTDFSAEEAYRERQRTRAERGRERQREVSRVSPRQVSPRHSIVLVYGFF